MDLAWRPDGRQLASAGADRLVKLWQLDGSPAGTLEGHTGNVYAASWRPDGTELATCSSDRTLRMWNAETHELSRTFNYSDPLYSLAWIPDSHRLVAGSNGFPSQIWEADGTLGPQLDLYSHAAFRPDGRYLVMSAEDRHLKLWDFEQNVMGPVLGWVGSDVPFVDWSAKTNTIAATDELGLVQTWHGDTHEPFWQAQLLPNDEVVVFSAAGRVLHGKRDVLEKELIYAIEDEAGAQHLLKPSAFNEFVESGEAFAEWRHSVPTPADEEQHLALARWAISLGGTVTVRKSDGAESTATSLEALPSGGFKVEIVNLQKTAVSDDDLATLRRLCRELDLPFLNLSDTLTTDRGLAHLAGMSIRALHLANTSVSDTGIEHVREINGLVDMVLRGTKVSDEGVQTLSYIDTLRSVIIYDLPLTDKALEYCSKLPHLEYLALGGPKISDAGLSHLRAHPTLHTFLLSNSAIGDAGMEHLGTLPLLERVELYGTNVTGRALRQLSGAKGLTSFLLTARNISNEDVAWLATAFPKLTFLTLNGTSVGDAGLSALKTLPKLTYLGLHPTQITDAGLAHLGEMESLEVLNIRANDLTDAGLAHLESLRNLTSLNAIGTEVTATGVAKLQRALPKCVIESDFAAEQLNEAAEGLQRGNE